ncbi:MAG TPA: pitrilysin family protein, partial [Polyangiaceae bacterium]|nr:pitrilysin family protein [Polyangiaceae bacterium]
IAVPRLAVLPNGLRVVVASQRQLHRAHVALWARVGSRYETHENNGIGHFLEHMIYRGTPRIPSAHAVNLAFERLGGSLFASTQVDHGIFSLTLPPDSFDDACGLFGEVLSQPAFLDIDIERGIVLEEILEDLDDEGRQVDADNLSRSLIYGDHPLGFTITGSEAHVRRFDEGALRGHHDLHYTADNLVLAFSGNVDEAHALRIAERDFGRLLGGVPIRGVSPEHAQAEARLQVVDNVSSQTELRVCLRALSERDPLRPALDVLMRIVDDGMSTRLYHRLCDARGLCYDVSAGYDGYEDDGVIDVAAGVQHKRVGLVAREVLSMFQELAREGPTGDELEKARRRIAWDALALVDSAEDMSSFFAAGLLFERFATVEDHVAELVRVTASDVREAARRVARPDRLNVVAVGLLERDEERRLRDVVEAWRGAA